MSLRALLLSLTLLAPFTYSQSAADFFDDKVLQDIRLTVAPNDWASLRQNYLENTYYPASFSWNNITLQIGIRSRGRGSRSPEKPNLYLNFDKVVKKQRFLGLEAAVLNGNNQDASHLHNLLAFKLFANMGLPAPRLALARLFINGEFFGLYSLVENLDSHFLDRNFGESDGYLYEYKPNQTYNFEWLGEDPAAYSPGLFDPANNEDTPNPAPFVEMVRAINFSSDAAFVESVSQYINPDLFLTHAAIENVLAEIDGMLGGVYGMNNFDFYRFEGSTLGQMIVWDKDLSFFDPERDILAGTTQNVLARRLLAMPRYRALYVKALVLAATTLGAKNGWADQEVNRAYSLIRDAALADPHKQCITSGVIHPCGAADFEASIQDLHSFLATRSGFVLSEVLRLPPLETGVEPVLQSATGALVPGSIATLWGAGFSATTSSHSGELPRTADDVFVSIDGIRAPLLFVSPSQINVQVPWEVAPGPTAISVAFRGQLSNPIAVQIESAAPSIFLASHATGDLVTSSAPASAGETLILWATGLGAVDSLPDTGVPAESSSRITGAVSAAIGPNPAEILYAGLAPGWVGLYQVNLTLPVQLPSGSTAPLQLTVAGKSAKIDVSIR